MLLCHGILQARIREWVAIPFSRGSSQPRDRIQVSNKFLGNIRETDAIIHVLRCFEDDNITHVDGTIDPIRDKEIIDTEFDTKLNGFNRDYLVN